MAMTYTESQTTSHEAQGSLDRDLTDIIYNISPSDTPLLNMIHKGEKAREMKIEWHRAKLRPPQKNQHAELEDYTFKKVDGVAIDHNYVQIFSEDGKVSDVMQKAEKTYKPKTDELTRQKELAMKGLAQDLEYALMVNDSANAEVGGGVLAKMGGLPYFLNDDVLDVTATAGTATTAPSVFTLSDVHRLRTGEYVTFRAVAGGTLPPELEANQRYYVRIEPLGPTSLSSPTTEFFLYNEHEDAVEGRNNFIVLSAPITTGTVEVLLNNVIDAGNTLFIESDLSDAVEQAYYRGGKPTIAIMSPSNKKRFSDIMRAVHTVNRDQTDHKTDVVTSTYETDFGVLTAMPHTLCSNNKIFVIDTNYWETRFFDNPHFVDNLAKTGSYEKFVITAAMTLQGSQPLSSACIKNIKRPPRSARV